MATSEQRIEKFLNRLSPKLSEGQVIDRMTVAANVAKGLMADREWQTFITKIYLFGSTVKGSARKLSDIDLGIETPQDRFFGMDFDFIHGNLKDSIERIRGQLKLDRRIIINHQILPTSYLNGPFENLDQKKRQFLVSFKQTAVLLLARGKS